MPNRILRPWHDSEAVNSLSDAAEVFFVRLIQAADDFGRFHGSPQLLKSYLFPLKDKRIADITRWIAECEKAGLIAEYEVSGRRYIEIRKFGQRMRVKQSKFPAPSDGCQSYDGHMTVMRQPYDGLRREARGERREEREKRASAPPAPAFDCAVDYPKSVADVLAIARKLDCPMTEAQASAYYNDRTVKDWHMGAGGEGRLIRPENVPADIRRWVERDRTDALRRQSPSGRIEADTAEIRKAREL